MSLDIEIFYRSLIVEKFSIKLLEGKPVITRADKTRLVLLKEERISISVISSQMMPDWTQPNRRKHFSKRSTSKSPLSFGNIVLAIMKLKCYQWSLSQAKGGQSYYKWRRSSRGTELSTLRSTLGVIHLRISYIWGTPNR